MDKYILDFYEKEDGVSPVDEFLDSLDAKMKAKILRIMDMLEIHGSLVRMPHSEPLGDGNISDSSSAGIKYNSGIIFFLHWKKNNIYKWIYEKDK